MSGKNWSAFTIDAITNLYLYGQWQKPDYYSDRIRDQTAQDPNEPVDAGSYLYDSGGPGRFAYPMAAASALVKGFFEKALSGEILGQLSKLQVKSALGITDTYDVSYNNAYVSVDAPDYDQRTFVWGHVRFIIEGDFIADGANSRIQNFRLSLGDDDFDLVSAGLAELNNELFLRPQIDPYQLGTSYATAGQKGRVDLPASAPSTGASRTISYADYQQLRTQADQIQTILPIYGFNAGQRAVARCSPHRENEVM